MLLSLLQSATELYTYELGCARQGHGESDAPPSLEDSVDRVETIDAILSSPTRSTCDGSFPSDQ